LTFRAPHRTESSVGAPTKEGAPVAATPKPELSQGRIFRFYSPLALSWIFMALEGPVAVAVISRMENPTVNTAAFLAMLGLALWVESPIIDLLATSTTLATSQENFRIISRFVWMLILLVTAVHALIAYTPLYWTVADRLLKLDPQVAQATQLGLWFMLPWSGLIGWRRYLQGILIRHGKTKLVGMGTALRVTTVAAVAFGLYAAMDWPGMLVASLALVTSVAAETAFVHLASRGTIREHFSARKTDGESPIAATSAATGIASALGPLTMTRLVAFHVPLTATTMVTMLSIPMVVAALSRAPAHIVAQAAWQVSITLMFLLRTAVFALPEVVIAMYRNAETAAALRKFCLSVGCAASAIGILVWLTGLDALFFERVLGAEPEVAEMARLAFIATSLIALIGGAQSYYRGLLTAHLLNGARLWSILAGAAALIGMLWLGVALQWTGVLSASAAITLAMVLELGVLASFWHGHGSVRHQ
jgi:hypothetical protein